MDLKITTSIFSVQEDMDCSPGSPFSAGSPPEQAHTSDNPAWVVPVNEGTSKQSVHTGLFLAGIFRYGSHDTTMTCFPSAFI